MASHGNQKPSVSSPDAAGELRVSDAASVAANDADVASEVPAATDAEDSPVVGKVVDDGVVFVDRLRRSPRLECARTTSTTDGTTDAVGVSSTSTPHSSIWYSHVFKKCYFMECYFMED